MGVFFHLCSVECDPSKAGIKDHVSGVARGPAVPPEAGLRLVLSQRVHIARRLSH